MVAKKSEKFASRLGANSAVWRCDDPVLLRACRKADREHHKTLDTAFTEAVERWNRGLMVWDSWDFVSVRGLSVADKDESKPYKERRIPPPGWRKRVKDDYLTPPLKGGSLEAEDARTWLAQYKRIPTMRTWLGETLGRKHVTHFSGMHLVAPGMSIHDGALWVSCAADYPLEHPAFERVKVSELLAAAGM